MNEPQPAAGWKATLGPVLLVCSSAWEHSRECLAVTVFELADGWCLTVTAGPRGDHRASDEHLDTVRAGFGIEGAAEGLELSGVRRLVVR